MAGTKGQHGPFHLVDRADTTRFIWRDGTARPVARACWDWGGPCQPFDMSNVNTTPTPFATEPYLHTELIPGRGDFTPIASWSSEQWAPLNTIPTQLHHLGRLALHGHKIGPDHGSGHPMGPTT